MTPPPAPAATAQRAAAQHHGSCSCSPPAASRLLGRWRPCRNLRSHEAPREVKESERAERGRRPRPRLAEGDAPPPSHTPGARAAGGSVPCVALRFAVSLACVPALSPRRSSGGAGSGRGVLCEEEGGAAPSAAMPLCGSPPPVERCLPGPAPVAEFRSGSVLLGGTTKRWIARTKGAHAPLLMAMQVC